MVKVATYFGMTLGAFMLWKTLDKVHVWIAPRQDEKQERLEREAEDRNPFSFDYKEEDLASEERLWDLYERWSSHYQISRSLTEKQQRFGVFKANLEYIDKVNKMDKPYKLGLNMFADMTHHEFEQRYANTMLQDSHQEIPFTHGKTQNLPSLVDWRKNVAVNDIKNQEKCKRLEREAEIRRVREELIRQAKEKETLV